MYFVISMKFLPKNLLRKFFCWKSTEYRYRRYFFKTYVIGAIVTFLAKYQYRYRRYFSNTECPSLVITSSIIVEEVSVTRVGFDII